MNLGKILFTAGLLCSFCFIQSAVAIESCEVNFIKYVNGDMPAQMSKNPTLNMWDDRFNADDLIKHLSSRTAQEQREYILELSKLVHKNKSYNRNISILVTRLYQSKIVNYRFLKKHFIDKDFTHTVFYYSKSRRKIIAQNNNDPIKYQFIKNFIAKKNLSAFYQREYTNVLMESNRSLEEIEVMIQSGMVLKSEKKHFQQFSRYMEFLDNTRAHRLSKGLKNIQKIYDFKYKHGLVSFNPLQAPHKQFLEQTSRLKKYTKRRLGEIEKGFKLEMKNDLISEIDLAISKEARGIKVFKKEKLRFKRKISDQLLPQSLKKRALIQAKHETNIYRRLLNGCNSGSSQRIAGAKMKFARFKFAMALATTPTFYIMKNKDKMDTDPYFWEKLGHEMIMGLVFTFVGNKIFTNTQQGFWKKYISAYFKFGALSLVEAVSYEELFGKKSAIRHLQKLYKDDVPESEIDEELKRMLDSPDFQKQIQELVAYLEEMSKKKNTKNFFDKHLNLSASSDLEDDFKITRKDLESEEAREFLMELLAERIYLQNMGDFPLFQTGRKDADRFAFYRSRNLLWDLKGLLLNLTLFEIMCREPFGKVGSWAAIIALVVGDNYLTGDITYQYRREMINQ